MEQAAASLVKLFAKYIYVVGKRWVSSAPRLAYLSPLAQAYVRQASVERGPIYDPAFD